MTAPDPSLVASTHGYYPPVGDAAELVANRLFSDMLDWAFPTSVP